MRVLYLIIIFFISFACKTNKSFNTENTLVTKSDLCPKDGVCTFDILKNTSYTIKKDEFGNSYSELLNGENIVLKFEYKRNELQGVHDSNYREIIYIELNSNVLKSGLTDLGLKKTTVGFERFCFCKGQTGAYNISEGTLILSKIKASEYNVILNFNTNKVPQVITSINENFKL